MSNKFYKVIRTAIMSIIISTLAVCVHTETVGNESTTEVNVMPSYKIIVASQSELFTYENKEKEVTVAQNNNINQMCNDETVKLASNNKPYIYYEVYDVRGTDKFYHMDYELQEYTYEQCIKYGIEEYFPLILCQFFYESNYRANLISGTNDYGIAQINKINHDELRKELGITNFLDPKQSIHCGVYIMSKNLKKYDVETALFCYNTGKTKGSNKYSRNIKFMWEYGYREILD